MSTALAIERHADAGSFLATAESWLLEAEAENNLLLGVALDSRGRPAADPPAYWANIRDASGIVACACRTPPFPLVLSRTPARAVGALAEDVGAVYSSLSGVNGPAEDAGAFARAWVAQRGGTSRTKFRLRLHELTRVALEGPLAAGTLREVTEAELPLACAWMDDFVRDTRIPSRSREFTRQLVARGRLSFWCDGASPRAMLSTMRETRSGSAINTVYTPPQFRGHGYATAAVATLSGKLLAAGQRFCCLYTDLANPTSNSIYAKIGYRPIRDDVELAFEP